MIYKSVFNSWLRTTELFLMGSQKIDWKKYLFINCLTKIMIRFFQFDNEVMNLLKMKHINLYWSVKKIGLYFTRTQIILLNYTEEQLFGVFIISFVNNFNSNQGKIENIIMTINPAQPIDWKIFRMKNLFTIDIRNEVY